jgi:uncharacterized protein YkwD
VSPRRALMSIAALVAFASPYATAVAVAAPVGDCRPGADWPAASAAPATDVVARVNAHRSGRGLPALAVSPTLTAAAEWKARHMARYGYMTHDDPAPPVQRTSFERIHACGYPEQAFAGENIAAGYESPASVMEAWLGSSGHRANIERADFAAIGVGVARGGDGSLYWAQDFGSVADAAAPLPPTPAPPTSPAPPPPVAPALAPSLAPAAAVAVRGACRRRGRRAAVCRLVLRRAPLLVRARLRRGGATLARGTVRAQRAGPASVRLRARRPLRRGRGVLVLRYEESVVRRNVRVR